MKRRGIAILLVAIMTICMAACSSLEPTVREDPNAASGVAGGGNSNKVKKNIYEFIDNSQSVELVVDCENSDPFKLASVLKQLDKTETAKIKRIVLYDDIHTEPVNIN